MKILISGVCGFVGSNLAHGLLDNVAAREIIGVDNLSRPGSQLTIAPLRKRGVAVRHADLRSSSDLESIASVDWIIARVGESFCARGPGWNDQQPATDRAQSLHDCEPAGGGETLPGRFHVVEHQPG